MRCKKPVRREIARCIFLSTVFLPRFWLEVPVFAQKPFRLGAAAERQVSYWAKTGTSSQNRRRSTVGRKMGLVICLRTGHLHSTSDLLDVRSVFFTKTGTSTQNRRRNAVDRKMHLAISRRTGHLHRTSDLRTARWFRPGLFGAWVCC